MFIAIACAGADRSGADCVNSAVTRLSSSEGSRLSATCDSPDAVVIVGMPPASRPVAEPVQIPQEVRALITSSRAEGSNWCAVSRDDLSKLIETGRGEKLGFECRRVIGELRDYVVTAGQHFQIEFHRGAGGSAEITGVKGDAALPRTK
jgi:hypothetical protein